MNERKKIDRNSGFTLIELLEVILIIGILFGITISALSHSMKTAKKKRTEAMVMAIANGIKLYEYEYGHLPYGQNGTFDETSVIRENMEVNSQQNPRKIRFVAWSELPEDDQGNIRDAWLKKLRLRVSLDDNRIIVDSAGPNGKFDDDDDISRNSDAW